MRKSNTLYSILTAVLLAAQCSAPRIEISGELKKWNRVTLSVIGPQSHEKGDPNPFLDVRLDVIFAKGERRLRVPGFYAADGRAAETSGAEGSCWRAHFMPDETGTWTYTLFFRRGEKIALAAEPEGGVPLPCDGATGSFTIGPADKSGCDSRARGMLRYVGERYLQYSETKEYYLKGGADSPENFLAFSEFDGTRVLSTSQSRPGEAHSRELHRFDPHAKDWREGDPTWAGGKGRNIIGALNYLAGAGMNSVYFLTMNVEGDGNDVWPWIEPVERLRYDCSKLDQWEIVFSHMDRLGLTMHVITQEQENDQLLDGGELGDERQLYYRELVSRFAHHPALVWNLGEENTNTDEQRIRFARALRALDPYDHAIVVHTFPGRYDSVYTPLLGEKSFEGPSLQMGNMDQTHSETYKWVKRSNEAGRPWVVCLDEIGPAHTGVKPDADDTDHNRVRSSALWGNLMAGGGGCEWYFGYRYAHNDLNCEDWRSRERMWALTKFALSFFQQHLPFTRMEPADHLVSRAGVHCLAREGEVYAIYFPQGGTTGLSLIPGSYEAEWYNPRTGGNLIPDRALNVQKAGDVRLGPPPGESGRDWAMRVIRRDMTEE